MRPLAVVFVLPLCDLASGVRQVSEPSSIQTFISHSSVEAFHMTVLGGFSGLDVDELNLAFFTPSQEMTAGEFRSVVAPDAVRNATAFHDLIERARDALAGEPRVYF